jgi:outer membrane protein assembly factor BamB
MGRRVLSALMLFAALGTSLPGADWPQWRGPNRDDVSSEKGLLKSWPKEGPPLLWTSSNAGIGYSGPAIVGKRLFTMGARDQTEQLFALDTDTGKEIWSAPIGPIFTFKGNSWGDGPRGTPTVDGDHVFALGGQGELICAEAATGKVVWRKSLPRDLGGVISPHGGGPEKIGWGYSESPLVDGDKLICTPGGDQGTLAALNKRTGQVLWRSQGFTDPATYASAVVTQVGGIRQYVQMTDRGAIGAAADDGRPLWRYLRRPPYPDDTFVIPTPIVHDTYVYTSTSAGCDLAKLSPLGKGFRAAKVYSVKTMKNQSGGVVLVGDHVYGYSDGRGWICHQFESGNTTTWYAKGKFGRGSLTYADGHLYCYGEDEGTAVLIEATPQGWKENGRFALPRQSQQHKPNGKFWTHPVVANGRLYLRDQELLFCFDVRDRASSAAQDHPQGHRSGARSR